MNVFKVFEDRIDSIFESAVYGGRAPLSFKKLAKSAVKEMESETFVVDGVDTAPALFTVLISPEDDAAMRRVYPDVAAELGQLLYSRAAAKNYLFVGDPVVRFLADHSIRPGKFTVFAENVDAHTLAKLRDEEYAFVTGVPKDPRMQQPRGGMPQAQGGLIPLGNNPIPVPVDPDSSVAGLDVMPQEFFDPINNQDFAEPARAAAGVAGVQPVPRTTLREPPVAAPLPDIPAPAPIPGHAARPATCLLINRQTGETFNGTAPKTVIGREKSAADIILKDPNVSRRHAELSYANGQWTVTDLRSTNGTLVNDREVSSSALQDGDVLTIGLLHLEFRES